MTNSQSRLSDHYKGYNNFSYIRPLTSKQNQYRTGILVMYGSIPTVTIPRPWHTPVDLSFSSRGLPRERGYGYRQNQTVHYAGLFWNLLEPIQMDPPVFFCRSTFRGIQKYCRIWDLLRLILDYLIFQKSEPEMYP